MDRKSKTMSYVFVYVIDKIKNECKNQVSLYSKKKKKQLEYVEGFKRNGK